MAAQLGLSRKAFLFRVLKDVEKSGQVPFPGGGGGGQQVGSDGFLHQRAVLALSLSLPLRPGIKRLSPCQQCPVPCRLSPSCCPPGP